MKILKRADPPSHQPGIYSSCLPGKKWVTVTQELENMGWNLDTINTYAGTYLVEDEEQSRLLAGSVIECEVCGQTWVKLADQWDSLMMHRTNQWRHETKREKRLRERGF